MIFYVVRLVLFSVFWLKSTVNGWFNRNKAHIDDFSHEIVAIDFVFGQFMFLNCSVFIGIFDFYVFLFASIPLLLFIQLYPSKGRMVASPRTSASVSYDQQLASNFKVNLMKKSTKIKHKSIRTNS